MMKFKPFKKICQYAELAKIMWQERRVFRKIDDLKLAKAPEPRGVVQTDRQKEEIDDEKLERTLFRKLYANAFIGVYKNELKKNVNKQAIGLIVIRSLNRARMRLPELTDEDIRYIRKRLMEEIGFTDANTN